MKKEINIAQAEQMVLSSLDGLNMGDKLYEMIDDLFHDTVYTIEHDYDIYDKDLLDSHDEWYDDVREDYFKKAFEIVKFFMEQ